MSYEHPHCEYCRDTGRTIVDLATGEHSDYLDCGHCSAAQERTALEGWAKNLADINRLPLADSSLLWAVHQRARETECQFQVARIAELEQKLEDAESRYCNALHDASATETHLTIERDKAEARIVSSTAAFKRIAQAHHAALVATNGDAGEIAKLAAYLGLAPHIDAQAARIAELEAQIVAASAPVVEQQPIARITMRDKPSDLFDIIIFDRARCKDGMALYAAPQAADTDKLRDTLDKMHNDIMNLPCKPYPKYSDVELKAYKYGHKDARHSAAELVGSTALQAPVREVPEINWLNAITVPDNWRKVAEHGNPPEGFYMAIYKGDGKSMPVTLAGYGEYEFYSEDDDRETTGIGWVEYSEDPSGDCFTIVRDVIAYLPVNVDMASLKAVRASLPAAPVQTEGE